MWLASAQPHGLTQDGTREGSLNIPCLLCVLVVDGYTTAALSRRPARGEHSHHSEDTNVCSSRPSIASAGHGLIARTVGAVVLATLAITMPPGRQATPHHRRQATSRPKKLATTEGGRSI
jgi:hypothetical protein